MLKNALTCVIIILLLKLLSVFKIGTHKGTYCADLLRGRKVGQVPLIEA